MRLLLVNLVALADVAGNFHPYFVSFFSRRNIFMVNLQRGNFFLNIALVPFEMKHVSNKNASRELDDDHTYLPVKVGNLPY